MSLRVNSPLTTNISRIAVASAQPSTIGEAPGPVGIAAAAVHTEAASKLHEHTPAALQTTSPKFSYTESVKKRSRGE